MIVLMVAAPLFALSSYVQGRLALSWREVSTYVKFHIQVFMSMYNTYVA
jgi:hypothetical protein